MADVPRATDGPWSSPAEHRAATTLAAVEEWHAANPTFEADPAEQLDQLRAENEALKKRLEELRACLLRFLLDGQPEDGPAALWRIVAAPLEVEQP